MPQVTTALTINDGAATPVARTFSPERVAPELTRFTEKSSPNYLGYVTLEQTYSAPTSSRKTARIGVKLALPVTATVNGVETVVDTGRATVEFIVPASLSQQNRWHLHAYLVNALNNTTFRAAIRELDPMF